MKERFEKIKEWVGDNSETIAASTYIGVLTFTSCYIGYVIGRYTTIYQVQRAIIESLANKQ